MGGFIRQLARLYPNAKTFENSLDLLCKLIRIGQTDGRLTCGIAKQLGPWAIKDGQPKSFFSSSTMVEVLGFMGFPTDNVVEILVDYLDASIATGPGIFEKYPWRSVEALAALEWNEEILNKLKKKVSLEKNPQRAALAWYAIGGLGQDKSVEFLNAELPKAEENRDWHRNAPEIINVMRSDVNKYDELKSVLFEFIISDDKEERWLPTVLAYAAGMTKEEIESKLEPQDRKRLNKRWESAKLILSSNLPDKFLPLELYLRDYKNYFFSQWARNQAAKIDNMIYHKELGEILQQIPELVLSIDKRRLQDSLKYIINSSMPSNREEREEYEHLLFDTILECLSEGKRQDYSDSEQGKGFTWGTMVILGRIFKQLVLSLDKQQFLQQKYEGIRKKFESPTERPRDSYLRDILESVIEEIRSEEKRKEK